MPPPIVRTGILDVYLLGRKVGQIDYSSHRNEMHFSYDAAYLSDADATRPTGVVRAASSRRKNSTAHRWMIDLTRNQRLVGKPWQAVGYDSFLRIGNS